MSLLRKLIPLVFVDSSFISLGSLLDGDAGSAFLSRVSLDSSPFSLLETLPSKGCTELSSGDDTDTFSFPSSKQQQKQNNSVSYSILHGSFSYFFNMKMKQELTFLKPESIRRVQN